jgi:trehalose synthase
MLPRVAIGRHSALVRANVDRYRLLVGDGLMDEVTRLARELSGIRVCHLNSTAYGGGVAELLSRYLPLIQGVGISAEWRLIHGAPSSSRLPGRFTMPFKAPATISLNPLRLYT